MTYRNFYLLTIWEMNLDIILNWRNHPNFEAITMQEEATKKGVPHYQGALLLNDRVSWASLKTWAQKNIGRGKCSVCCKEGPYDEEKDIDSTTKDYDNWQRVVNYCSGNSGNGLMKCANLNNRFYISKAEIHRIETSIEGIRQWNRNHEITYPEWKKANENGLESLDRNDVMSILKKNIANCKKYIMQFD